MHVDSYGRRMNAPTTPQHDGARRKHVAYNLHLVCFTLPLEVNNVVSPHVENMKQLRKNYPFLFPLLLQYTSPCLCINFTVIKCHDKAGHPQPYPNTRGLLGLQSTDRGLITVLTWLEATFIYFYLFSKWFEVL
jgi:hypothetical protein